MKECPICHTQYDDTQRFCVKDGHELISRPVDEPQFHQDKPQDDHSEEEAPNKTTSSGPKEYQQPVNTPPPPKKMSKMTKIIIAVVVLIGAFVAFYQWASNAATYLRLEPTSFSADKGGGKTTIGIDYDGYVWNVNHKPEWVELKENDRNFELLFAPNTSGKPREGTITIQSGKHLAKLEITQKAFATYIKPSVSIIQFSRTGGSKKVKIETDGIHIIANYPEFLKIDSLADGISVKASPNDGEYRQGTIILNEDDVSAMINFEQGGKCPYCHGNGVMTCTNCGGTGTITYGFYYVQCGWCGGSGGINCSACKTTGMIDIVGAKDDSDSDDKDN